MNYEKELRRAIEAAKLAEKEILRIYQTPFEVETKSDDSPVTAADKIADKLIREYLAAAFPDYGFLTEESQDTDERFSKEYVWIVDPVDGTKEFVSRNGQFTTNIALARNGEIVVGVINAPILGLLYYAVKGEGAYRLNAVNGRETRIHVSDRNDNLRAMRSISFYKEDEKKFMAEHRSHFEGMPMMVGAALKFCRIAEGSAEFFYRISSGTKEWDVAPGDLIVKEAGGFMGQPDGTFFTYNRHDVYNRNGYVIANKKENAFLK